MANTLLLCGHGTGISDAVARKFGQQGFTVALVARNGDRLNEAVKALGEAGVTAKAFPCDLGDPAAVRKLVGEVRASLGPVTALHWNAYAGVAGDLTSCSLDDVQKGLNVSVLSLIAAVQELLPDLKQAKGAVLVTGGGLAFHGPQVDTMTVQWGAMGLGLQKSAQHKVVGMLHHKLAPEGVYVADVVVMGPVKGTAFDRGGATIEASGIADKMWEMYQARSLPSVNFP